MKAPLMVQQIMGTDYTSLSNEQLKSLAKQLRERAIKGESLEDLRTETFALASEAAFRTLGERPFDTQLMAAKALTEEKIVQMQTGEGKTLSAVLAACLLGWTQKGVHILTFNDYLARRDARWMGPVYDFLGFSAGFVGEGLSLEERRRAYLCDITYVTAKEAGFDYLKDFLCLKKEELVHRAFNKCIVDEADSIMIDEARIPLVIAGKFEQTEEFARKADELVRCMKSETHYAFDQYANNIYLTDDGLAYVEGELKNGDLYDNKNLGMLSALNAALHAYVLLSRDKHYIVRNGAIELVDEFTGRVAYKRLFPNAIQTAVELKEKLVPQDKGSVMGQIPIQYFLSLYPKRAGMTGTAKSGAFEFKELYNMEIEEIPPHRPCIRRDEGDRLFDSLENKEKALIDEIVRRHEKGQPVLIGTRSVEESERLSEALKERKIPHNVLNAKNDEMEAAVIADAGKLGTVTVSTNMAGRGVDIKLGGETGDNREQLIELGGLYVIGTGRNESVRIDNQLRGRSGRQGDPGESRFFVSLEDEIFTKYGMEETDFSTARKKADKNGEITADYILKEVIFLQKRIEGYHSDVRLQLIKYNMLMEQQRRLIYERRMKLLLNEEDSAFPEEPQEEWYEELCQNKGTETVKAASRQLLLRILNTSWRDYLDFMNTTKESIHLVALGNKNPVDEFNRQAIEAYDQMAEGLEEQVKEALEAAVWTEEGPQLEDPGLVGPSTTWTYLMDESSDSYNLVSQISKGVGLVMGGTLFSIRTLAEKFKGLFRKG